jgi:asparagine synthase (glutamine-hydrolysing)
MCGIAGLFNRDGRPVAPGVLSGMADALAHRGPDDSGVWFQHDIGFAHRRLAIRDLSPAGHQPLVDPSGRIVVTYNGEIYNDAELRDELVRQHGVVFHSTCDTEIIPAGYMAWGDGLFDRLEGMYAIALWDQTAKRIVLARDGIGIKPLFYYSDAHVVRFASEIKALLADPRQPDALDPVGVHKFLAMGYVGPTSTTLKDIRQVPPGHLVSFTSRDSFSRQFWQPTRRVEIRRMEEAAEEFERVWSKVVGDQLISDVPVGVLQSGGIDSTLVSLAANRRTPTPLFTASFADASFDETSVARQVAARLGMELTLAHVQQEHLLADILATVNHHYDGQVCDEASVPLYLLSEAVSRAVTVALCGDGGDEFFVGYPTYRASRFANLVGHALPRATWSALGRIAYERRQGGRSRLPLGAVAARFALGLGAVPRQAHVEWRRFLPAFLQQEVYGPQLRPLISIDPFEEYRRHTVEADGDLVDRCLLADQRFHLPGGLLLKTDAMTMAHSLEVRVPFLDRRVMDFAGRCDWRLSMGMAGRSKRLLRRVAERMGAPSEIVRAPKRGFNAPLSRLLRHELRPLAVANLHDGVDILAPWLRADGVQRLWLEHDRGLVDHAYALWPILNLAVWLRQRSGAVAPRTSVRIAAG